MSFSGGNGRIWIQPVSGSYDVSLSGKSLTAELQPQLESLFGAVCKGHKQPNERTGKLEQPYWRTENLSLVEKAVHLYSKTRK